LIASGLVLRRSAKTRWQFAGLAPKKCADAILRLPARRTSRTSGGHLEALSVSRSHHAHPARIASARMSNWFAIVPRYRPPAWRRRQVAIKVARSRVLASRRRKTRISLSVRSQSKRNSTVRVWRSACWSCFHIWLERSAATTAQILSSLIISP